MGLIKEIGKRFKRGWYGWFLEIVYVSNGIFVVLNIFVIVLSIGVSILFAFVVNDLFNHLLLKLTTGFFVMSCIIYIYN